MRTIGKKIKDIIFILGVVFVNLINAELIVDIYDKI
jgi:hypothetical protein